MDNNINKKISMSNIHSEINPTSEQPPTPQADPIFQNYTLATSITENPSELGNASAMQLTGPIVVIPNLLGETELLGANTILDDNTTTITPPPALINNNNNNFSRRPLNELKSFCASLKHILHLKDRVNSIRGISGSHDVIFLPILQALSKGDATTAQVLKFIADMPAPISKMYFYTHLAKALFCLNRQDEAKETCKLFIQLAVNHQPRFFCYDSVIPLSNDLRPDAIDICYSLMVMPKLLSAEEIAPLMRSIDTTLGTAANRDEELRAEFLPEEALVLLILQRQGYQISPQGLHEINSYLAHKDMAVLSFEFLDNFADMEIALAILDMIKMTDDEDNAHLMLTDFIKLRWQHLINPEVCRIFTSVAISKHFFDDTAEKLPPGSEPILISTEDNLFLDTEAGRLSIFDIRFTDENDDFASEFLEIQHFILSENGEDLINRVKELKEELEDEYLNINDISDYYFQKEPIEFTEYVQDLIRTKLLQIGLPEEPFPLVTIEALNNLTSDIPSYYKNRLEGVFPSTDLVARHRQYEIAGWLVENNAFQSVAATIETLQTDENTPLNQDILKVLVEPSTKKRKASSQLVPSEFA